MAIDQAVWVEIFADPELTPAALRPLLVESVRKTKNGVESYYTLSDDGREAKVHFAKLWENPSFSLMSLEMPALSALQEVVEEVWLDAQNKIKDEELCNLIRPQVRERTMPLLEETMALAAKDMHPLVSILWAGRQTWPCFVEGDTQYRSKPKREWEAILTQARNNHAHLMEFNAFLSIVNLMYPQPGPSAYFGALVARALVGCVPLLFEEGSRPARLTLVQKRLFHLADQHLLRHLQTGAPLHYGVLRAPRLVGAHPIVPLTDLDREALASMASSN